MSIRLRHTYILRALAAILVITLAIAILLPGCRRPHADKEYAPLLSAPLDTLLSQATAFTRQEKYDSAYRLFAAVSARYSPSMSHADKFACERASNNAGYISHIQYYDYPQAYAQYLRALEIADEINELSAYPYIYINIGNLMCATGNWHEGMQYQRRAMAAALRANDTVSYLRAAANIFSEALIEDKIQEFDTVIESFPTSLRRSDPLWLYTYRLQRIAQASLIHDNTSLILHLDSLRAYDDSALAPEERMKFFRLYMLAKIHQHNSRPRIAIDTLKSIEALRLHHPELLTYLYQALSDNYKLLGLRDSAASYRLRLAELTDTVSPIQKQATIYELKNAYQTRSINFRVELLSHQRTLLIRTIWIIIIFSIITLTLLICVIISRRKTLRAKKDLYNRNQELLHLLDSRRITPRISSSASSSEEAESYPTDKVQQDSPDSRSVDGEGGSGEKGNATLQFPSGPVDEGTLVRIREIFESSPEIFAQDFSVEKMAAMLSLPVRKVSKTINDGLGQNFSTTLQTYRIREACRRLSDIPNYGHLTVEAIAESLGFKSRSNFTSVFKKMTGLTPAAWQKLSRSSV